MYYITVIRSFSTFGLSTFFHGFPTYSYVHFRTETKYLLTLRNKMGLNMLFLFRPHHL
jgi:hypothetical protein